MDDDPSWYQLFARLEKACVDLDRAWTAHKDIIEQAHQQGRDDVWAEINDEFQARRDELVGQVNAINAVIRFIPGVDYVSANGLAALPAIIAGVTIAQAVLVIGAVIAAAYALQTTARTFYTLVTGKPAPDDGDSIGSAIKLGIIGIVLTMALPYLNRGRDE